MNFRVLRCRQDAIKGFISAEFMQRRLLRMIAVGMTIGLAIALTACTSGLFNPKPALKTKLLISAAASLKDVLNKLEPLFEQRNRSVEATYNFASSGALQQQIEQGAPADIMISAASKQMDALEKKGLILQETRRNLLTNRLVLVVPNRSGPGSGLGIASFQQLAEDRVKRIAIAEPNSVPAGQYAQELFRNLGILATLQPKFVLGNSVRNVLAAVESGNADAGVVYETDAKLSKQVKAVATASPKLHAPIVYPIAVLKRSQQPMAARAYTKFLQSDQAIAVFKQYGFGVIH
jgi:molybdate transport system substrate-binding protein